jgi:hypothetical protein
VNRLKQREVGKRLTCRFYFLSLSDVGAPAVFKKKVELHCPTAGGEVVKKVAVDVKELDVNQAVERATAILTELVFPFRNSKLSDMRLTALPAEISQLKNLRTLVAFKNELTSLPPALAECPKLETISVRSAPSSHSPVFADLTREKNGFFFFFFFFFPFFS